ncbi:unnamed protein product [Zymoseptoria tritici ST99CH_1E4]|uniref:Uncharacterized protein n=1 Tax=Zymoseptoria tritici ST99CH_1E4 TaxID=1276532 RepID=A0A2H1FWK3_ZYMTR|nr:unnamed protein product [Zymoseptoria tritici ST99CH_1E4]
MRPPTAVWNEAEGKSKNISTGRMRPLYTSCSEHYHALERNSLEQTTIDPNASQGMSVISSEKPQANGSPFLRLPTEIRLHIYSLLVLPRQPSDLLPSYEKITSSTQDYYDYDKTRFGTDRTTTNPTLHIRTFDPQTYPRRYGTNRSHIRSKYSVRGQSMRFRCMETTYHCVNNPKIESNMALLRTNKQIHAEAAELLYGSYTFDFDTHVEAIAPFMADLTPFARSCIKSVRIVKRALAYQKEFDKCEWSGALRALTDSSNGIALRKLELGIVAGRPGPDGWDDVSTYNASDFGILREQENMEWIQYLLAFRGLQELEVDAVIEHCPPVTSSTNMANYVRFSASVEGGFREWLKGEILVEGLSSKA